MSQAQAANIICLRLSHELPAEFEYKLIKPLAIFFMRRDLIFYDYENFA